jgi:hypothetical protein
MPFGNPVSSSPLSQFDEALDHFYDVFDGNFLGALEDSFALDTVGFIFRVMIK